MSDFINIFAYYYCMSVLNKYLYVMIGVYLNCI